MDDGRQRLHALFLEELEELLEALNRGLVRLEGENDPAARASLIQDLFRHAHTLKGAAHSAGIRPVASACHTLEERLDVLRRNPAAEDPSVAELFELVDAVAVAASSPLTSAVPRAVGAEAALRQGASTGGTMRVSGAKLETLLQQASDLLIAEEGLAQLLEGEDDVSPEHLSRASRSLRQAGTGVRNSVRTLRMAPFTQACDGLERLARDMAAAAGKRVQLEVRSGEIELDRPILEALHEPLAHLVRNAVDHGIEAPAAREAAGKPALGRIHIDVRLQGGQVRVELSDDGVGVDPAAVRAAATARGLTVPDGMQLDALFAAGFSTLGAVTETSGRGVGLDAVRASVEAIGGTVEMRSTQGAGTTVRMLLPLTLSALRIVLVELAGVRFGLESSVIDRVMRVDAGAVVTVEGRPRLLTDDGPMPIVRLSQVLGLPDAKAPGEGSPVVVATTAGQQVAIEVEVLGAELEVMLTGLGERIAGIPAVLGGAVLPDGSPIVVLNPAACARLGMTGGHTSRWRQPSTSRQRIEVLLVDDSLTTRTLERAILEGAGYHVSAAADGQEALELAGEQRFDVVVSDVAMPRLDGVTLCERLRASPRHADVPVILVTSRASDEDRLRGLEAGATAYLTKQAFDQGELLATIAGLVGSR